MEKRSELEIARHAYAKRIMASVGLNDLGLESAYASTPREDFLGPGPWKIFGGPGRYTPTASADPICLYSDDLIGIVPERGINNGQPSLHAILLAAARIKEGDHVVHVGAGTGYYTAIMAHLVGSSGRVTAIEFDPNLAIRAKANFLGSPNVQVLHANGASARFDAADVIYVNAGTTGPAPAWLEGLSDGGRLILPLTTDASVRASDEGPIDFANIASRGAVFRIERRGADFDARWVCPAAFILAEGIRDPISEAALAKAFEVGDYQKVTRLYRSDETSAERCWLQGSGWCLAYE
jgi:protein-L-isoaspartate(D-aspartate) O-methyltransferase